MSQTIADVLLFAVKIFSVYFFLISVFTLLRPKAAPETDRRLRFAVLVAARNEEKCIAGIIESIKAQDYPSGLVQVYVLPNNCTDDTEGAARRAGAEILHCSAAVRSKGAALREGVDRLLQSDTHFDAFCVFDADNEADPQFLSAMNRTLQTARVAKSRILSKNHSQSWVCACYEIYFCFANQFLNRARENIGLSARLIGTGFAVRRDYLEEQGGFHAETITEDAEFYADCAVSGERIAFCEGAVTYDEEPLSFSVSLVQRRRWMSGIMQVTAIKVPKLLRGLRTSGSFFCFDALMQLVFGYVQALMPLAFLFGFLAEPQSFLAALPLTAALSYVGGAATAAASLILQKRMCRGMIWGILAYPVFVFSFIPLQTISLFKKTTVWREIHHTGVRRFKVEHQPM